MQASGYKILREKMMNNLFQKLQNTHQNLLMIAESFGFSETALSLAITLITFPSTTGTA